jgi:hypothetical protein
LFLDHTRIPHLWAKDLPTVTHRGKVAVIHYALVGLGFTAAAPHRPRRCAAEAAWMPYDQYR